MTESMWRGVLPADGTTATSMRRGTLSPVRLSIIQTPISTIKPFWRPINLRSLWPNQPFNQNHLRPCPLLDNYGRLADMVEQSGAKSTDLAAPEDVHTLCGKCKDAAEHWAVTAGALWAASHPDGVHKAE